MSTVLMGSTRDAMPFDLLGADASEDLLRDALSGVFSADKIDDMLAPKDDLAKFIYALSTTPQGREFFEWFMDMTLRAPYRCMGKTIEETALWAAKREGINLPGELLLAAIARGKKAVDAKAR